MEGTQACGAARFSCPPNFTAIPPATDPPRFSLEALTGPDTELWLIQAPADFAPHCLNGRRVPLTGSQIVKGKLDGKRHRYQVLGSCGPQAGEATLLAPSSEAGGRLTPAPAPQGSLRIIEGPQEFLLSGIPLQTIPASLPPQIPSGLRPRFSAFGGSLPVTGPGSALALSAPASGKRKKKRQVSEAVAAQDTVNGHGAMEVDAALGDLEMDSGKKKKRKKQVNEAEVAEPAAPTSEPQDLVVPSTTSCKRKKSTGTETVPPELGVLEAVVETQPPDGAVLSPPKKRKKPKGAEGVEATEETTAPSQPQVSVEPEEEAMPRSHKKKRKEKRQRSMIEPGTAGTEPGTAGTEPGTEGTEPGTGLQGLITEPELLDELGPQAEAVVPPKKKKKEKQWTGLPAPGLEVVETVLPTDSEPQAAPASTQKKEKAKKSAEPRAEVTDAGDSEEPEAGVGQRSAKKRRKDQESGVSDSTAQGEASGSRLEHQSGKRSPTERKKKTQKRRSQQEPA